MSEYGFPKPKRKPKRPTRELDPKYVWWIHSYPCLVCKKFPVHAHHVKSRGAGGSDRTCVPLCLDHHTGNNGIHVLGNIHFQKQYQIDLEAQVKDFNERFEAGEEGPNFRYLPDFKN